MDQLVSLQPYKRGKKWHEKFISIFHTDMFRMFNLDSIKLPDTKILVIIAS